MSTAEQRQPSSSGPPLRLTVEHVDGAVIDLDPGGADLDTGHRDGAEVRAVANSSLERAMGRQRFEVMVDGWVFRVIADPSARAILRERAGQGRERVGIVGLQEITAQIPGRVVRVWVAEGDTVEAGQRLLAIEAMKMENEVRATRAGIVEAVAVAVGSSVELGAKLLVVR